MLFRRTLYNQSAQRINYSTFHKNRVRNTIRTINLLIRVMLLFRYFTCNTLITN